MTTIPLKSQSLVLNFSNLHAGGAVQVAVSFLEELAAIKPWEASLIPKPRVIVSRTIVANLRSRGLDIEEVFDACEVCDVRGIDVIGSLRIFRVCHGADICFTLFGPVYFPTGARGDIVGFAQPWIAFANSEIMQRLPLFKRLAARVRLAVQASRFRRANRLIVEIESARSGLSGKGIAPTNRIDVVPNCVSSVFRKDLTDSIARYSKQGRPNGYDLVLGYLGRGYPHKNLSVLPHVLSRLRDVFGIRCALLVTLTSSELVRNRMHEVEGIFAVGEIAVPECPGFFAHIDGLIFPSLLECYSATPLEAMAMRKPVFASDRPFLRDTCCEHAFYFNPLDPMDIASVIADWYENDRGNKIRIDAAYQYVLGLPGPTDRAMAYCQIIREYLRVPIRS